MTETSIQYFVSYTVTVNSYDAPPQAVFGNMICHTRQLATPADILIWEDLVRTHYGSDRAKDATVLWYQPIGTGG